MPQINKQLTLVVTQPRVQATSTISGTSAIRTSDDPYEGQFKIPCSLITSSTNVTKLHFDVNTNTITDYKANSSIECDACVYWRENNGSHVTYTSSGNTEYYQANFPTEAAPYLEFDIHSSTLNDWKASSDDYWLYKLRTSYNVNSGKYSGTAGEPYLVRNCDFTITSTYLIYTELGPEINTFSVTGTSIDSNVVCSWTGKDIASWTVQTIKNGL